MTEEGHHDGSGGDCSQHLAAFIFAFSLRPVVGVDFPEGAIQILLRKLSISFVGDPSFSAGCSFSCWSKPHTEFIKGYSDLFGAAQLRLHKIAGCNLRADEFFKNCGSTHKGSHVSFWYIVIIMEREHIDVFIAFLQNVHIPLRIGVIQRSGGSTHFSAFAASLIFTP